MIGVLLQQPGMSTVCHYCFGYAELHLPFSFCMLGWTTAETLRRLERPRGSNPSIIAHAHCFQSAKSPSWGEGASGSENCSGLPWIQVQLLLLLSQVCLLTLGRRTLEILQDTLVNKIQGKNCNVVSVWPLRVLAWAYGFQLCLGLLHFTSIFPS